MHQIQDAHPKSHPYVRPEVQAYTISLFLQLIIFGIFAEQSFLQKQHENKSTILSHCTHHDMPSSNQLLCFSLGCPRVFGKGAFDVKLHVDEVKTVFVQLLVTLETLLWKFTLRGK